MKLLIASVVSLIASQSAYCKTVYIYDNMSATAKIVNDIPVWKDSKAAQSSSRDFYSSQARRSSFKCLDGPPASGALKQTVGKAVEVRVYGGCTGFVNSRYIHAEK